ncbi:uncharacterized protein YlaI [Natronobacillus azotifigens]|uniref:YlaI family protein n=1 Tax=Natronobacillus azotifigens TaxID=472978 RepID=A0A9J6RF08_9BACI|nr:YlaI family protein [Natronobacillus azotifigens]MCZ0703974.1 YlaI family protein [Natronobacillus azotifigens]
MDVKCPICDSIDTIDTDSPLAKRLRNRRKHLYLCPTCTDRIGKKTNQRHATGKFQLFKENKDEDPFIR